jgi:hypothetical protein
MFLAAAVTASCASPADIAGNYTVNVTNGENGCSLDGWTAGATTTAIPFVITQSDADATGSVEGLAGTYLDLVLGNHIFTGEVRGDQFEATLYGTRPTTRGMCTSTVNVDLFATLDGDFLEGTLTYSAQTNGAPDCAELETCENIQSFNGTRPPTE